MQCALPSIRLSRFNAAPHNHTKPSVKIAIKLATVCAIRSEYYFSEENLQKDFFLRRKMDEEGYLPVSLIASFHRVEALTRDLKLVIEAVRDSDIVEVTDGVKVGVAAEAA